VTQKKTILMTTLVVGAVYFLILPGFWSWVPPSIAASIPAEWPHNQDLPLDIRISAWHPNYKVTQVRLYFDHKQTKLNGLSEPLRPIVLLDAHGPQKWNPLTLNRLTFPRRETMHVVVPLEVLAGEGKVGPGITVGTLDVLFSSAGSASSNNRAIIGDAPYMNMAQIAFQMQLK
jgi:hypothetical protein